MGFRRDVAPDLHRVPAQGTHRIRPELQNFDMPFEAGRVQQRAPACAEVEHHRAQMPLERGFVGHAHSRHRLAKTGVAGKHGVHQTVQGYPHLRRGQVASLGTVLVTQYRFARHGGIEAHALRNFGHDRAGRTFLEQAGRGVGRQLPGGQEGRIARP